MKMEKVQKEWMEEKEDNNEGRRVRRRKKNAQLLRGFFF